MKPTRGQIAQAFGVPAAAILDTSIRGTYPPLQWARAAFVGITFATSPRTYAHPAPMAQHARDVPDRES